MQADSLTGTLKNLIMETVNAGKPCDVYVAKVESVDPIRIRLSEKAVYGRAFVTLSRNISQLIQEKKLKKGHKVLILRENGGQHFYVLDKLDMEGEEKNAT